MHEEKQPNDSGFNNLDKLFDGDKVLQTFRHFSAIDVQMPNVDKVSNPFLLVKMGF